MRHAGILILCLVFLATSVGKVRAQEDPGVRTMIFNYYTAINQRNYGAAYNLWNNPPQTYQQFSAGFADTDLVIPYIGASQPVAGTNAGHIPVVLLVYHTNGGLVSYYGCFSVRYLNPASVGWRITGAGLRILLNSAFPDNATVTRYLWRTCDSTSGLPQLVIDSTAASASKMSLKLYYDLINRRDYGDAYNLWLKPLPGPKPNGAPAQDYRLPYPQYVSGYLNTTFVTTYFGNYTYTGGSAGHGYVDGLMPVFLIGQHSDGTVVAYSGCYVLGRLAPQQLGIINGRLLPVPMMSVPEGSTITMQLMKIDCLSMGLPD